jgi:hypothetical protein
VGRLADETQRALDQTTAASRIGVRKIPRDDHPGKR